MNRRSFIKTSCGAVSVISIPALWSCNGALPVRFGLITDVHFADRTPRGTRFYDQSKQKLLEAIHVFNKSNLNLNF
jgi:alkaline phosphatase